MFFIQGSKLINTKNLKENIYNHWHKSARYHTLLFFMAGFTFDIFTLKEVDDTFTVVSQLFYLFTAVLIFLLNSEQKNLASLLPNYPVFQKVAQWEEEVFHFALGALLNAFILYFFKSSTFTNSLLLLTFLSALLCLNEFRPAFLKHDIIPSVLIHTCLLSFSVILAPTMIGRMGIFPFLLGVVIYLAMISIWLRFRFGRIARKRHFVISGILVAFFLTMYLTRIFPPVPLSLKKIGIYHQVEKVEFEEKVRYMTFSSSPWWAFWNKTSTPFQARPDDSIYVFTRVFAPAGFSDTVYIEWWWESATGWIRTDRIPLEVTGGRRDGFRGFSYKRNYDEGNWKVVVTTSNGLEIGRTVFNVKRISADKSISLYSDMY